MKFIYSEWDAFCKALSHHEIHSITAATILKAAQNGILKSERFVNLKHDVESSPLKALDLARIEAKYGHCATYYVQAYLMTDANQHIFAEIQRLGHEVTYHHDVIDGGKGNLSEALSIYKKNLAKFKKLGFEVETVCQHGNPVSNYENRDFFRSTLIQNEFPMQADIMVDFMDKIGRKYIYISDVGMSFKIVTDPVNSDKVVEAEKYIILGEILNVVPEILRHPDASYIVSAHPHRYNKSAFKAVTRKTIFIIIKAIAKILFKVPGLKKLLFRFNSITKHL